MYNTEPALPNGRSWLILFYIDAVVGAHGAENRFQHRDQGGSFGLAAFLNHKAQLPYCWRFSFKFGIENLSRIYVHCSDQGIEDFQLGITLVVLDIQYSSYIFTYLVSYLALCVARFTTGSLKGVRLKDENNLALRFTSQIFYNTFCSDKIRAVAPLLCIVIHE